ncbi:type II toxin-antitoxin system RelE/ParE family toxin [Actinoallomurus spadix]|uniref:DNA-binding protein n=1 Tax=Actinoallomurus spadix TaxID=79912 RepID=A0ABP3G411_9ACTN|nr:type II toxin-antitoxin system RelE/ParE family toxin [Actinoallomurus spadix]
MSWEIYLTDEVLEWLDDLEVIDPRSYDLVLAAINQLELHGPALGRPMVDRIVGSKLQNLKELRPGSAASSELRVLFVFDPWRSAVLLVAGDKAGKWSRWYAENIPVAEQLYERYLGDRMREG